MTNLPGSEAAIEETLKFIRMMNKVSNHRTKMKRIEKLHPMSCYMCHVLTRIKFETKTTFTPAYQRKVAHSILTHTSSLQGKHMTWEVIAFHNPLGICLPLCPYKDSQVCVSTDILAKQVSQKSFTCLVGWMTSSFVNGKPFTHNILLRLLT